MKLQELSELGLTQGQIKVFQAVFEFGLSGINNIQEKTGLERRAIYDIMNKLIEKGFISYIEEKGSRKYQATHPRNLKEKIEEKQKILSSLNERIPDLTEFFNAKKPDVRAQVYRGNKAIQALLNEALEYEISHWMGGNSGVEQCNKEMHLWFKRWMIKRVELKRPMYDLVDHGTFLEDLGKKSNKKQFYYYQQLPKGFNTPMVLIMFGNKVAQVLWSKQPFAFVLESEEIRESFMKYFEHFWKK